MGKIKSLNICRLNARSINAKSRLFQLDLLAASNNMDVLCVPESWLNGKHPSTTVRIRGFDLPLRCDRSNGRGGGVAVYVRQGLCCTPIGCPSSLNFQCVVVSVTQRYRSSPLTIITSYRPPDSDLAQFVNYMDTVLSHLSKAASRNICLAGDFNAKHSCWLPSQSTDLAGSRLFAFAASNGLT